MFVLPNFCVINYLYFGIITLCYYCNAFQGRSYVGGAGRGCRPRYSICRQICRISILFVNVVSLMKLQEIHLCRQIELERSLFVGRFELCTPATIIFSLASDAFPIFQSNGISIEETPKKYWHRFLLAVVSIDVMRYGSPLVF